MGMTNTFTVSGTALNAQSIHLDMIARNMANAQSVSGTENGVYKARRPVFSEILETSFLGDETVAGVRVDGYSESNAPGERQHAPGHPLAGLDGYIYLSNVNIVEEMANMMQVSRIYRSNVEVLNTTRQLLLSTLSLGNS